MRRTRRSAMSVRAARNPDSCSEGSVMTIISRSALVPFGADKMYALVDDIPSYPTFLPWCAAAQELNRNEDEVSGRLDLAVNGIQKSFTTHNRLQKNKMIEMRLLEGPFKHLEGFWRFEVLDEHACKVSLDIEFEFSNRLLDLTLGPVFSQICSTLIDAFLKRAHELYGNRR